MTKAEELRRVASQLTNKDLSGKTLAPIIKAIADAMIEGGIAGVWGNGQVVLDSFQIPTGTVTPTEARSFIQGIGLEFTFRFTVDLTIANPDAESMTMLFIADVHKEVPEDFWAMGIGYIHTTDGSGGYTPVIVEIGPSAEGGSRMAVHVSFPEAMTAGNFLLSGYVSGTWNGAGYDWPTGQRV